MSKPCQRALLTVLCLCLTAFCIAQDGNQNGPESDQPVTTLRSNVNVVNLFFNVKDKHKGLVAGLTKDDFQVFEDGKQQTIKYFSATTDEPLTLGILIDTSLSQRRLLPEEEEVGGNFLSEILRPKDMAFVISFDEDADLVQDFTNSTRDLRAALNRVKINAPPVEAPLGLPGSGGNPVPTVNRPRGTVLFDAVYLASDEKLKQEVGRKAMVLLTDGEDQGSRLKLRDAMEAAQKADAMIYVLLIADRSFYYGQGASYSGDSEMRKLAEETGGRVIDVGSNAKKMKEAFDQISAEMRSQYNIGYTPTNRQMDGTFRKVQIKTKEGLKIQARTGYFAPKAGE